MGRPWVDDCGVRQFTPLKLWRGHFFTGRATFFMATGVFLWPHTSQKFVPFAARVPATHHRNTHFSPRVRCSPLRHVHPSDLPAGVPINRQVLSWKGVFFLCSIMRQLSSVVSTSRCQTLCHTQRLPSSAKKCVSAAELLKVEDELECFVLLFVSCCVSLDVLTTRTCHLIEYDYRFLGCGFDFSNQLNPFFSVIFFSVMKWFLHYLNRNGDKSPAGSLIHDDRDVFSWNRHRRVLIFSKKKTFSTHDCQRMLTRFPSDFGGVLDNS